MTKQVQGTKSPIRKAGGLRRICLALVVLLLASAAFVGAGSAVDVTDQVSLKAAIEAGGDITLQANIETTEQITVTKTVTLDLNGHSIKNTVAIWNGDNWSLISVQKDGDLTIKDTSADGTGLLEAIYNDCYGVDVRGGKLTINGGKYIGSCSAVYVYEGEVIINGGTFDINDVDKQGDKRYLLNALDANYKAGTAEITVNGGSFVGFDPSDSLSENPHGEFVTNGFVIQENKGVYTLLDVATIGDKNYATLEAAIAAANAGETVTLIKDIKVTAPIVVNEKITLNLNGKTISNAVKIWKETETVNDWSLISVRAGGDLTIIGNGNVHALADDCYAVDVQEGGKLTINGGDYLGNWSTIYAREGSVVINGGHFDMTSLNSQGTKQHLINARDQNYNDKTATIVINGGSFVGFNPENNAAEGEGTNFMAAESQSVETVEGTWTVGKLISNFADAKQTTPYTGDVKSFKIESDLTGFNIAYSQNGKPVEPINAGLYNVTITREASSGNDGWYAAFKQEIENGLEITQVDQLISFENPAISKSETATEFTNPITQTGDGVISYISSNEAVATVDAATGKVTIVAAGTTTITATAEATTNYKEATATYQITVYKSESDVVITGNEGIPETHALVANPVEQTQKDAVTTSEQYVEKLAGATVIWLNISLLDADGKEDHSTEITFTVPYPAGITFENADNYNFVVLHLKADGKTVEHITAVTPTENGLKITSTVSPFALGYTVKEKPQTGSSTPQGSSVWLQEPLTPTPTETPTDKPTDSVPTDIPTTQPTEQPKSPGFGVLAVLAGLGAVAVLRRK